MRRSLNAFLAGMTDLRQQQVGALETLRSGGQLEAPLVMPIQFAGDRVDGSYASGMTRLQDRVEGEEGELTESERTVSVVWYTRGAKARRFDFSTGEEFEMMLSLAPGAAQLDTINSVGVALNTHASFDLDFVLGAVNSARTTRQEGTADILYSSRPEVAGIVRDIREGIIRAVSVGFTPLESADVTRKSDKLRQILVTAYEPREISNVAVGAISSARTRLGYYASALALLEAQRPHPRAGQSRAITEEAMRLRELLNQLITGRLSGDTTRDQVFALLATAAGVDVDQVAAYVDGTGSFAPTVSAVQSFAGALSTDAAPLLAALREDMGFGSGTPAPATPPTPAAPAPAAPAPSGASPDGTIDLAAVRSQAAASGAQLERLRQDGIRSRVARAGLPTTFSDQLVNEGLSLEDSSGRIFDELARLQNEQHPPTQHVHAMAGARIGQDERETFREGMAEALLARAVPSAYEMTERAASLPQVWSLRSLAELALERAGVRGARHLAPMQMVGEAFIHTSSDFPAILANAMNKRIVDAYTVAPRTFPRWCRRGTLSDFKVANRIKLGQFAQLLEVPQGAEFFQGTIGEEQEPIQLVTYGRLLFLSRQMVIDDDMSAFDRLGQLAGAAGEECESLQVYTALVNGTTDLMADGVALFDLTTHNNLQSGAISVGTISTMEAAMATQPNLQRATERDNAQPVNVFPRYMIVPPALWTLANQVLRTDLNHAPATDANANPYRGQIEPIREARLAATFLGNNAHWYLSTDPNAGTVETFEYAYLNGQEGIFTEQEGMFTRDGFGLKARLDFAVKAIDWRGLQKSTG